MQYTVTATIQSQDLDAGEPVDVQWYNGPSLAVALAAMGQAATSYEDRPKRAAMPKTLSVRLDFIEASA